MGKGKKKEDSEIRDSVLVFSLPTGENFAQPLIDDQSQKLKIRFSFCATKNVDLGYLTHSLAPSFAINKKKTILRCKVSFVFCCSYKGIKILSVTKKKKGRLKASKQAHLTWWTWYAIVLFSPVSIFEIRMENGDS